MKLFTRYNRINLVATVVIFLLSGLAFYFLLKYILTDQVDEDLKIEQHEIETYAGKYRQLPEIIPVRDQHISYTPIEKNSRNRQFTSIWLKDDREKEQQMFRQLTFYIAVNNQWYRITVRKSLEGTDDMIHSIVSITLATILLILLASFFINRLVLKKLWQPFYSSLAAMQQFELGKNKRPHFPATRIEEFNVMNETLSQATARAHEEYRYLKEFTENASHELQTPLAIIRSKLDVLIQDENLSEPQSRNVQGAYEAIQRLSRLNQGLLLLAKIENGQYTETSLVNVADRIKAKLEQFAELAAVKSLQVTTHLDQNTIVRINPELFDILINNLLSNAIKYNKERGNINILVKEGSLEISNTAIGEALDENLIFRRFSKSGLAQEGVGLGLAIIKQAAEVSGFETRYSYTKNQHHFSLTIPNRS
jgi:signal transduction histidine kinase